MLLFGQVILTQLDVVEKCSRVYLEPESVDDWEYMVNEKHCTHFLSDRLLMLVVDVGILRKCRGRSTVATVRSCLVWNATAHLDRQEMLLPASR